MPLIKKKIFDFYSNFSAAYSQGSNPNYTITGSGNALDLKKGLVMVRTSEDLLFH